MFYERIIMEKLQISTTNDVLELNVIPNYYVIVGIL